VPVADGGNSRALVSLARAIHDAQSSHNGARLKSEAYSTPCTLETTRAAYSGSRATSPVVVAGAPHFAQTFVSWWAISNLARLGSLLQSGGGSL
jgi:hypothetical protein